MALSAPKSGQEVAEVQTSTSGRLDTPKPTRVYFAGHVVLRRIAKGGTGDVYEAEHPVLGRRVALKVLPSRLTGDRVVLERFLREARAAAQVAHPNVITVYEVGQDRGRYFLSMELMDGSMADAVARQGKLPWQEATRVIAESCRGLSAAHARGLVHRDIKPGNIMSADDGRVKVADFGLVTTRTSHQALTLTGEVIGTPQFMSPEQGSNPNVDARSDIYSLGATYYYLLTGRFPFVADNPLSMIYKHASEPVPDPAASDSSVPEGVSAVIRRAMAKDPADRYQTAAEMLADLEAVLAGRRPASLPAQRPTRWLLPAAVFAAVGVAAAVVAAGVTLGLMGPGDGQAAAPPAAIAAPTAAAAPVPDVVPAAAVGSRRGQTASAQMVVRSARREGAGWRLSSGAADEDAGHFDALVFAPALAGLPGPVGRKFDDAGPALVGRAVIVTGKVQGEGRPTVTVREAGKLALCPRYSAAEAGRHAGEWCQVEFPVRNAGRAARSPTWFLNSAADHRDPANFSFVLRESAHASLERFGVKSYEDLEGALVGKTVRAAGRVGRFNERYDLVVEDAGQLDVLD